MIQLQSLSRTIQALLLFFFLFVPFNLTSADPPYDLCLNTTNYIADSMFQYNVNNLLTNLISNASVSNFYHTSSGNDTNTVYGLYMCLDYITNESCLNCITMASQDISQLCPYDTEAVVWEEVCQLRYSDQNFFGHLDVTGNIGKDNIINISEPKQFDSLVNVTLSNLAEKAAFDPSANKYATGEVPFFGSYTLYALVQCTGDLSTDDCSTCLQAAIKYIPSCCYASRGARVLSRSCYLRYELYAFYEGQTENSAPDPNKGKRRSGRRKIWVPVVLSIVSASLAVVILGSCLYCFAMKVRNEREKKDAMNQEIELHDTVVDQNNKCLPQNSDLTIHESAFIDLPTLRAATNNFSTSNFLGQGGFGPVYKGVLWNGKEIAIKRLSNCSEQGTEEFTNEVLLIIKLQHKNLVRLLGFCVDGEEKLLVYEFMPNSSLDVFLFDPRKRARLCWSKRSNIINRIAKGILYLHEDSRLRIIHRDLKASNVLLDYDMNPKISDFGMARIFVALEGEANTARIVGTFGYMAPEYAMEGLYSAKSDVFSFGVLLLEIITGRKNAGFRRSKRASSLLAYAWQLWNEGNEVELIDPLLADSCSPDEFSRYIHIGLLCVQQDAYDRPTMSSVAVMLRSETITLSQPQRPPFSVGRFVADANSCSVNGLTSTDFFPR